MRKRIIVGILILLSVLTTCDLFKVGLGSAVDLKVPEFEIKSHKNDQYVKGTITFSGTASDDIALDKIELKIGDNKYTGKLSGSGENGTEVKWSFTIPTLDQAGLKLIKDGDKNITFTLYDKDGNKVSKDLLVHLDNTPPVVRVSFPTQYSMVDIVADPIDIQGEAWDAFGLDSVSVDLIDPAGNRVTYPASGDQKWLATIPFAAGFSEGTYTYQVKAKDRAGNISREQFHIEDIYALNNGNMPVMKAFGEWVQKGIPITPFAGDLDLLATKAIANDDPDGPRMQIEYDKEKDPPDIKISNWSEDALNDPLVVKLLGVGESIYASAKDKATDIYHESVEIVINTLDAPTPRTLTVAGSGFEDIGDHLTRFQFDLKDDAELEPGNYMATITVADKKAMTPGFTGSTSVKPIWFTVDAGIPKILAPDTTQTAIGATAGTIADTEIVELDVVMQDDLPGATLKVAAWEASSAESNAEKGTEFTQIEQHVIGVADEPIDENNTTEYRTMRRVSITIPEGIPYIWIDITAQDAASDKRRRTQPMRLTIDRDPPSIKVSSPTGAAISGDSLTASGNLSPDSVAVYAWVGKGEPPESLSEWTMGDIGGTDLQDPTKKLWNCTLTLKDPDTLLAFEEGTYKLYAMAKDASSMSSPSLPENTVTFELDQLPPEVEETGIGSSTIVNRNTNFSLSGAVSDTNKLGSLEILASRDGAAASVIYGIPTINAQGTTWSYTVNVPSDGSADGVYEYTINAIDIAGRPSAPVKRSVRIDTRKPNLTITAPAAADLVSSDAYQVRGIVTDNTGIGVTIFDYRLNGSTTWIPIPGRSLNWTIDNVNFGTGGEGVKTLQVRAGDGLNDPVEQTVTFNFDLADPELTEISGYNETLEMTNSAVILSGEASDTNGLQSLVIKATKNGIPVADVSPAVVSDAYTYTLDATPENNGKWVFTLIATDVAGRSRSLTRSIWLDTIKPATPGITAFVGQYADQELQANGTTGDGTGTGVKIVEYSLNNTDWTPVTGTDPWFGKIDVSSLDQGLRTLYVRATDYVDNISDVAERTFTIDRENPELSVNSVPSMVSIDGSFTIDGLVSDTLALGTVPVSVTATRNSAPYVLDSPVAIGASVVNAGVESRTWSQDIEMSGDGVYQFTINAQDKVGRSAIPISRTVIVDSTDPIFKTISGLTDGALVTSSSITITGETADTGSGVAKVEYSLDGGLNWILASGTVSFTVALLDLPQGLDYELQLRATDNAGNVSAVDAATTIPFKVDTALPETSVLHAADAGSAGSEFSGTVYQRAAFVLKGIASDTQGVAGVAVSGTANAGVGVQSYNSGTKAWSAAVAPLADGVYEYTVTVTDVAGRSAAFKRTVMYDASAPSVTLSTNLTGWQRSTSISVSGTAADPKIDRNGDGDILDALDDGSGIAVVQYSLDYDAGTPEAATWIDLNGTSPWSGTVEFAQGPARPFALRARDGAGNWSAVSATTVAVDGEKPGLTEIAQAALSETGSAVTFSGLVTDNYALHPTSPLVVKRKKNGLSQADVPIVPEPSGAWSYTQAADDGLWDLSFVAQDHSGQTTSVARTFTIDTTAPVLAVSSPVADQQIATGIFTISGTSRDTGGVGFDGTEDVEYQLNDSATPGVVWSALSLSGTDWSVADFDLGLTEGAKYLHVKSADRLGNESAMSVLFYFDKSAPTFSESTVGSEAVQYRRATQDVSFAGAVSDTNAMHASAPVQVSVNSAAGENVSYTVVNPKSGTWSYTFDVDAVADGQYALEFIGKDIANRVTKVRRTVFVDKTAPGTIGLGAFTNTESYMTATVNAAGTAGDSVGGSGLTAVEYQIQSGSTPADGAGSWAAASTWTAAAGSESWEKAIAVGGLGEGPYTLYVRAKDKAGNVSAVPAGRSFMIDRADPLLSETAVNTADTKYVKADLTISGYASDSNGLTGLTVKVGAAAAVPVAVDLDGADNNLGTTGDNNYWSYTIDVDTDGAAAGDTTGLAEGSYAVVITATDAGTRSTVVTRTVVVDTSAPTVTPAAIAGYKSGVIPISGTAAEVGASGIVLVEFQLDAQTEGNWTQASGTTTWTGNLDLGAAAEGARTLYVRVTDRAGNAVVANTSVNVDRAEPRATFISHVPGQFSSKDAVVFFGTADDAAVTPLRPGSSAVLSFSRDGGAVTDVTLTPDADGPDNIAGNGDDGRWSWTLVKTAGDGLYTVSVTVTDAAGKETSDSRMVQLDTTGPVVEVNNPTASATVNGMMKISGGASDQNGLLGVKYLVTLASVAIGDLPAYTNAAWTAFGPAPYTADTNTVDLTATSGTYKVYMAAEDKAGNVSVSAGVPITIDQSTDLPEVAFSDTDASVNLGVNAKNNLKDAANLKVTGTISDDDLVDASQVLILVNAAPNASLTVDTGFSAVSSQPAADGKSVGFSHTFTAAQVPNEGAQYFYLRVRDESTAKGGLAVKTTQIGPVYFAYDTAAPSLTVVNKASVDGKAYASSFTLDVTAQDNNGITKIDYSIDGGTTWTATALSSVDDTAVNPAGTADITVTFSGAENLRSVKVRSTDGFDRTTVESLSVTYDKTAPNAPVISSIAPAYITDSLSLTGTAMDGGAAGSGIATVEYSVDGGTTWNAMTGQSNWYGVADYTYALSDAWTHEGAQTVKVRAVDRAGNVTVTPAEQVLMIDRAIPVLSETAVNTTAVKYAKANLVLSGIATDTNAIATASFDHDNNVVTPDAVKPYVMVKVGAAAAVPVAVDLDGADNNLGTTGDNNFWTCTIDVDTDGTGLGDTSGLSVGSHTVVITAMDAGGRTSTVTRTVAVDTTVPTLGAPVGLSEGDLITSSTFEVSVTANDPRVDANGDLDTVDVEDRGSGVSAVQYSLDGGAWTNASLVSEAAETYSYRIALSGLTESLTHSLALKSIDNAANESSVTTLNFKVDTALPSSTITHNSTGSTWVDLTGTVNKKAGFTLKGLAGDTLGVKTVEVTGSGTATVTYTDASIPGDTSRAWQAVVTGAASGLQTYTVVVTDEADQTTSYTANVMVDPAVPAVAFTNIAGDNSTVLREGVPKLTGTITDASGVDFYTVRIDTYNYGTAAWVEGVPQNVAVADNGTTVAIDYALSSLDDGRYRVTVTPTDMVTPAANSGASSTVEFSLDKAVPKVDSLSVTEGEFWNTDQLLTVDATDFQSTGLWVRILVESVEWKLDGGAWIALTRNASDWTGTTALATYDLDNNAGTADVDMLGGSYDGVHTLSIRVTDRAGTTATATRNISIDTKGPVISADSITAGKSTDGLKVNGEIEFTFNAYDALAGLELDTGKYKAWYTVVGDGVIPNADVTTWTPDQDSASPTYKFTYDTITNLRDGANPEDIGDFDLWIAVRDTMGNVTSRKYDLALNQNTDRPVITVDNMNMAAATNGTNTLSTNPTIMVTVQDDDLVNASMLEYRVDVDNGTDYLPVNFWDGTNKVPDGDTTDRWEDGGWNTFEVLPTGGNRNLVQGKIELFTRSPAASIPQGNFQIQIRARDTNAADWTVFDDADHYTWAKTASIKFAIDYGPPVLTMNAGISGTYNANFPVSGTAVDPSGVTSVQYRFGNGAETALVDSNIADPATFAVVGGGANTIDVSSLVSGEYTLYIIATDATGSSTSQQIPITIDKDGPTVDILQPASSSTINGASVKVSGEAADNRLVGKVFIWSGLASAPAPALPSRVSDGVYANGGYTPVTTGMGVWSHNITSLVQYTAPNLVNGLKYRIDDLGTPAATDWTAIGADASPAVGEVFTKNAVAGTGDGLATLVDSLADGFVIRVVAVDAIGNVGTPETIPVKVDQTADKPTVEFSNLDTGTPSRLGTGAFIIGTVTDDDGVKAGSIQVRVDGNGDGIFYDGLYNPGNLPATIEGWRIATSQAASSTIVASWNHNISFIEDEFGQGKKHVEVRALDMNGAVYGSGFTWVQSDTVEFSIDYGPPTLLLSKPVSGSMFGTLQFPVQGTTNDGNGVDYITVWVDEDNDQAKDASELSTIGWVDDIIVNASRDPGETRILGSDTASGPITTNDTQVTINSTIAVPTDGTKTVQIASYDTAGAATVRDFSLVFDTTAPAVTNFTLPAADATVNGLTTVMGLANDTYLDKVYYAVTTSPTGPATLAGYTALGAAQTYAWQFSLNTAVGYTDETDYYIHILPVDKAGNYRKAGADANAYTRHVYFSQKTDRPKIQVTSITEGKTAIQNVLPGDKVIVGTIQDDDGVDGSSIEVQILAEDGVTVLEDWAPLVSPPSDGPFVIWNHTAALADGKYRIKVRAYDANSSDYTGYGSDDRFEVMIGSNDEDADNDGIRDAGETDADNDGYLDNGAADDADAVLFAIDSQNPVVTAATPAQNYFSSTDIVFSGTADDGSGLSSVTFRYRLQGAPVFTSEVLTPAANNNGTAGDPTDDYWDWSKSLAVAGLAEGIYDWQIEAVDPFGKSSIIDRIFTLDKTAPLVTMMSPENAAVVNGTTQVSGTATDKWKGTPGPAIDGFQITSVRLWIGAGANPTPPAITSFWAQAPDDTHWKELTGTNSWTYLINTTTLVQQASCFASGNRYRILDAGDVNWTDIGASSGTVGTEFTYDGDAVTGTGTATVISGTYSIFVRALDNSGNVSDLGAKRTITINPDTNKPVVTLSNMTEAALHSGTVPVTATTSAFDDATLSGVGSGWYVYFGAIDEVRKVVSLTGSTLTFTPRVADSQLAALRGSSYIMVPNLTGAAGTVQGEVSDDDAVNGATLMIAIDADQDGIIESSGGTPVEPFVSVPDENKTIVGGKIQFWFPLGTYSQNVKPYRFAIRVADTGEADTGAGAVAAVTTVTSDVLFLRDNAAPGSAELMQFDNDLEVDSPDINLNNYLKLTGTAEDSNRIGMVQVKVGAKAYLEAEMVGGSYADWTFEDTDVDGAGTLADESQLIVLVKSIDVFGKETEESYAFTIDKTGPTSVISTPLADSLINGILTVNGSTTGEDFRTSDVYYFVEDGTHMAPVDVTTWPAADGTSSWDFAFDSTTYGNGVKTLKVAARDNAGNIGATATRTVIFDQGLNRPVIRLNGVSSYSLRGTADSVTLTSVTDPSLIGNTDIGAGWVLTFTDGSTKTVTGFTAASGKIDWSGDKTVTAKTAFTLSYTPATYTVDTHDDAVSTITDNALIGVTPAPGAGWLVVFTGLDPVETRPVFGFTSGTGVLSLPDVPSAVVNGATTFQVVPYTLAGATTTVTGTVTDDDGVNTASVKVSVNGAAASAVTVTGTGKSVSFTKNMTGLDPGKAINALVFEAFDIGESDGTITINPVQEFSGTVRIARDNSAPGDPALKKFRNGYFGSSAVPEKTTDIEYSFIRNYIYLGGEADIADDVALVELDVNGEGYERAVNTGTAFSTWTYSRTVAAPPVNGANVPVLVRVTDYWGRTTEKTFNFKADNELPSITVTAPTGKLNGVQTITGGSGDGFSPVSKVFRWTGIEADYEAFTLADYAADGWVTTDVTGTIGWNHMFDTTSVHPLGTDYPANPDNYMVAYTAVDAAGNFKTVQITGKKINQDADRPVIAFTNIVMTGSASDNRFDANPKIIGTVQDDDGVHKDRILISVNGAAYVPVSTPPTNHGTAGGIVTFTHELTGLTEGTHTISIRAGDIGTAYTYDEGTFNRTTSTFSWEQSDGNAAAGWQDDPSDIAYDTAAPVVTLTNLSMMDRYDGGYVAGNLLQGSAAIVANTRYDIMDKGTMSDAAWTALGADASPAIGETFVATAAGSGDGQVRIAKKNITSESSMISTSLNNDWFLSGRAVDGALRTVAVQADPTDADVPVDSLVTGEIYRIKTLGTTTAAGMWTAVGSDSTPAAGEIFKAVAGAASGDGIATLVGSEVTVTGANWTVPFDWLDNATGDSLVAQGSHTIRVTSVDNYNKQTVSVLTVVFDGEEPEVSLISSASIDSADVNTTDNRFDMNLVGFAEGEEVQFSGSIPAELTAGTVYYIINHGATSFQVTTVKGAVPSIVNLNSTGSGSFTIRKLPSVNGTVIMSGTFNEASVVSIAAGNNWDKQPTSSGTAVTSWTYTFNSETLRNLTDSTYVSGVDPLKVYDTNVRLKATDLAGNVTQVDYPVRIDISTDRPSVNIVQPVNDSYKSGEVLLSGTTYDDTQVGDGVESVWIRIDANGDGDFVDTHTFPGGATSGAGNDAYENESYWYKVPDLINGAAWSIYINGDRNLSFTTDPTLVNRTTSVQDTDEGQLYAEATGFSGFISVQVCAVDNHGTVGAPSALLYVFLDEGEPEITSINVNGGVHTPGLSALVSDTAVPITARFSDDQNLYFPNDVKVSLNGGSSVSVNAAELYNWSTITTFASGDVHTDTNKIDAVLPSTVTNGTKVVLTGPGAPAGIMYNTAYFVVGRDATSFQLSATSGGSPVDIAGNGSGTQTLSYPGSNLVLTSDNTPAGIIKGISSASTSLSLTAAVLDGETGLVGKAIYIGNSGAGIITAFNDATDTVTWSGRISGLSGIQRFVIVPAYTITPAGSYSGPGSLQIRVTDRTNGSDTATIDLSIDSVDPIITFNDPVALPQNADDSFNFNGSEAEDLADPDPSSVYLYRAYGKAVDSGEVSGIESVKVFFAKQIASDGNQWHVYAPQGLVRAHELRSGAKYRIVTQGTGSPTLFTNFGSTSNAAGWLFTATGPATGDGLAIAVDAPIYDKDLGTTTEPTSVPAPDIVQDENLVPGVRYRINTVGTTNFTALGAKAVSAGSFVVGETYRIATTGGTDFTLIGADDSNTDTVFTATGTGESNGSGTAFPISTYFIATGTGSGTGTALIEYAISIDTRTELGSNDDNANGDADGFQEMLRLKTGDEWYVDFNTRVFPDGPLSVHFVATDEAGNTDEGSIAGQIVNNPPSIDTLTLGGESEDTDTAEEIKFKKGGTVTFVMTASDAGDNNDIDETTYRLIVKNKYAVGVNGIRGVEDTTFTEFSYDSASPLRDFNPKTGGVSGSATLEIYTIDDDGVGPHTNDGFVTNNWYRCIAEVKDADRNVASQEFYLWVNNSDTQRPTIKTFLDFDQTSITGLSGHVEEAVYSAHPTADGDADLSGSVKIRGRVWDDSEVSSLTVEVDYGTGFVSVGSLAPGAMTAYGTNNILTGFDYDYELVWNTATQPAGKPVAKDNIMLRVYAEDVALPNTTLVLDRWYKIATADAAFTTTYGAPNGSIGTVFKATASGTLTTGTAKEVGIPVTKSVDVVPYITSIWKAGKEVARTHLGKYPIREGDTAFEINGFNINGPVGANGLVSIRNAGGTRSLNLNVTAVDTTNFLKATVDIPATTHSGYLYVTSSVTETVTGFIAGNTYRILAKGTTTDPQWTAIGADATPAVGETFTAIGKGPGTGTATLLVDSINNEGDTNDTTLPQRKESVTNKTETDHWTDTRYIQMWTAGTAFDQSTSPLWTSMALNPTNKELIGSWTNLNDVWYAGTNGITRRGQAVGSSITDNMYDPSDQTDVVVDENGNVRVAYLLDIRGNATDWGYIAAWSSNNPVAYGTALEDIGNNDNPVNHTDGMDEVMMQFKNPRITAVSLPDIDSTNIDITHSYVSYYDSWAKCLKYAVVYNNGLISRAAIGDQALTGGLRQQSVVDGDDFFVATPTPTKDAGLWSSIVVDTVGESGTAIGAFDFTMTNALTATTRAVNLVAGRTYTVWMFDVAAPSSLTYTGDLQMRLRGDTSLTYFVGPAAYLGDVPGYSFVATNTETATLYVQRQNADNGTSHVTIMEGAPAIPAIMYYDFTNQKLWLARGKTMIPNSKGSAGWQIQEVTPTGSGIGQYVDMKLDTSGNIHAVAFDSENSNLVYIYGVNKDGPGGTGNEYTFTVETVDDTIGVGVYPRISVLGTTPHISYIYSALAGTKRGLKYAYMADGAGGAKKWEYGIVPSITEVMGSMDNGRTGIAAVMKNIAGEASWGRLTAAGGAAENVAISFTGYTNYQMIFKRPEN